MPIRRAAEAARLEPRNGAAVVILAAGPPAGPGTDDRPMRKLTTMNSVVGRVSGPARCRGRLSLREASVD